MGKLDFNIENGVLKKYLGSDEHIILPDDVQVIGFNAFNCCNTLVSMEIPAGVSLIESSAFWKCENLKSIIFLGKIPDIKDGAILMCNNLQFDPKIYCTTEKLPFDLIDFFNIHNMNISEKEYAWLLLFQSGTKWKNRLSDLLVFGELDSSIIAQNVINIISNISNLNKKMRDKAIQSLLDIYQYEMIYKLLDKLPVLSIKEVNSYIEKYNSKSHIRAIFEKYKNEHYNNNNDQERVTIDPEHISLTEGRKIYSLKNVNEGIMIKKYIGDTKNVVIPKTIGPQKVVSVEIRTFYGKDVNVCGFAKRDSCFQNDKIINASSGNKVLFGQYFFEKDGEIKPIEWVVLSRRNNILFLTTTYAIDVLPYNQQWEDVVWENSDLRKWLNGVFLLYAFSEEERNLILTTYLNNAPAIASNVIVSNDTEDKVFLLSIQEVQQYLKPFGVFVTPTPYAKAKKPIMLDENCRWWLRTPGTYLRSASAVAANGIIMGDDPQIASKKGEGVDADNIAIRPAIQIDISSIVH